GVDSPTCGASATPCRSITQTMANAASGDTIQVRPGIYGGNTNFDAVVGGPGEEVPTFGGMLTIVKPLIILSTDGAAATLIEGLGVITNYSVLILAGDVEFGRPGHGFMVTPPQNSTSAGIGVFATNVKVRGNLLVNGQTATGILTANAQADILIEKNEVVGWDTGIAARGLDNVVSKNQVSRSVFGIYAAGGDVVGNVVVGCTTGIKVDAFATAIGNAVNGNRTGILTGGPAPAVIQKNNIFGNSVCGLTQAATLGVVVDATDNYWGAATGPGSDPA